MSARVDVRGPVERMEDIVLAADFELSHPDEPVERCECGATLLRAAPAGLVCAGCGLVPSYKLHPGASISDVGDGRGERSPETSTVVTSVRKGADAPGGVSVRRRVAALSAVLVALLAPIFLGGWRS